MQCPNKKFTSLSSLYLIPKARYLKLLREADAASCRSIMPQHHAHSGSLTVRDKRTLLPGGKNRIALPMERAKERKGRKRCRLF